MRSLGVKLAASSFLDILTSILLIKASASLVEKLSDIFAALSSLKAN